MECLLFCHHPQEITYFIPLSRKTRAVKCLLSSSQYHRTKAEQQEHVANSSAKSLGDLPFGWRKPLAEKHRQDSKEAATALVHRYIQPLDCHRLNRPHPRRVWHFLQTAYTHTIHTFSFPFQNQSKIDLVKLYILVCE